MNAHDTREHERSMTGGAVLGVLTIIALGVIGLYGVVEGYLVTRPAGVLVPMIGAAAVAVAVVVVLALLGMRGGRPLRTSYW